MRMYDIIAKKRDGMCLTSAEIDYVVNGFSLGKIPDYQMSALLMAIYLNGMNEDELAIFTKSMVDSGDTVNLSDISGVKVDKHSTGGVGDKTTLIVAPLAAALGLKVPKMSGRGLGFTGGTIDKLESIPGFKTTLDRQEFIKQVNDIGISVIGQSQNLACADKKIYALRDVTATIESLPMIAASIMSKKIACGADCILLDVKCGSGAFMKRFDDAVSLAKAMVSIGEMHSRKTAALITNMNAPLGFAVGNALEVNEAIEVLRGKGPSDLREVSIELTVRMLMLAGKGDYEYCKRACEDALSDSRALQKFRQFIMAQGGEDITQMQLKPRAKYNMPIFAPESGYLGAINCEKVGFCASLLGAGRETKDTIIDYNAGIILFGKPGDNITKGDLLATLYADDELKLADASNMYLSALEFFDDSPVPPQPMLAFVDKNGVQRY